MPPRRSFFIQFRHNTGKTTEIVISTVGFCLCSFSFSVFCGQSPPPLPRRLQVATQQQLAVATSASTTSTIANRQRHQLGARLACISFLLRLHLTLFCCPRLSDCLSFCLRSLSLSLYQPLPFSLLFSCLAVDHLSSVLWGTRFMPPIHKLPDFQLSTQPRKTTAITTQQQQQHRTAATSTNPAAVPGSNGAFASFY